MRQTPESLRERGAAVAVRVSQPPEAVDAGYPDFEAVQFLGTIDTGAMTSMLRDDLFNPETHELSHVGSKPYTGFSGSALVEQYLARIQIGSSSDFEQDLIIGAGKFDDHVEFLIGRDILIHAKFEWNGPLGVHDLTFPRGLDLPGSSGDVEANELDFPPLS